jgi:hypothetical protein
MPSFLEKRAGKKGKLNGLEGRNYIKIAMALMKVMMNMQGGGGGIGDEAVERPQVDVQAG